MFCFFFFFFSDSLLGSRNKFGPWCCFSFPSVTEASILMCPGPLYFNFDLVKMASNVWLMAATFSGEKSPGVHLFCTNTK
uniref:Putative secreted protein ovary overexpressed n=1 Tax=Rhipicephalus microplus TaxID=6941 RepID=A0A6M2DB06_RHIMP